MTMMTGAPTNQMPFHRCLYSWISALVKQQEECPNQQNNGIDPLLLIDGTDGAA